MSTCDYCGGTFHSGGVTLLGVGTFCGHQCKVLQIYTNAGIPIELHYFKCPVCQSVLVTKVKGPRPERCRCSGSWLTFLHTVPVETAEQRALWKRGQVWQTQQAAPEPWLCGRCGETQSATSEKVYRPDGITCRACYGAEEHPPLLTPEQIEQNRLERQVRRDAMLDAQERAIQEQAQ